MSSAYKKKIEIWQNRKLDRQALEMAKKDGKDAYTRKGKESWYFRNKVK